MDGRTLARALAPPGVIVRHGTADEYDPGSGTIILSLETYYGTEPRHLAFAAHEAAHAIQHRTESRAWFLWSTMMGPLRLLWAAGTLATAFTALAGLWIAAAFSAAALVAAIVWRTVIVMKLENEATEIAVRFIRETGFGIQQAAREHLDAARTSYWRMLLPC